MGQSNLKSTLFKTKANRNAAIFVALMFYTILTMFITAAVINKQTQGKYISMEAYLAAEEEISLLKDKVSDAEQRLEEQKFMYETQLSIYESEMDYILSEFHRQQEDQEEVDCGIPEQVKYESLPPQDGPSTYRAIPLKTEEQTPVSGLTLTEMNELVNTICEKRANDDESPSDNPFYNTGETFFNMERDTGINALYVMAIFTTESGFGENMCRSNNAGGVTNSKGGYKSFNTIDDCILYTGDLLSRYRDKYNLETIEEIGSRYCPVNPEWPDEVSEFVELYSDYV